MCVLSDFQIIELPLTANGLLNLDNLSTIADHLRGRGLVVLPTETGYLLGVNALDVEAVQKVYEVKMRPPTNPIHAVVSGVSMAEDLVFLDPKARRIMNVFLPGPITVICPKKPVVSDLLVANTGNLGIRMPDSPVTLQVVQASGIPITATSLNLSGKPNQETVEETIQSLNWEGERVVYLVKEDVITKHSKPSTVVTFATDPWNILREGPILKDDILQNIT